MSTFKAINHTDSSQAAAEVTLAADLAPVNAHLAQIARTLEVLCMKCDSEDIADAIAKVQLRVDIPEIRPLIDVKPPEVLITMPELRPTINVTAAPPVITVAPPQIKVEFVVSTWAVLLIAAMPPATALLIYLLRFI